MRTNSTLRGTAKLIGADPRAGAWAALVAALAAGSVMAGFAAVEPARAHARLNSISARASAGGASVVLEASEPVAYVTSRPDPLTVVVDLRNATAAGAANRVKADQAGPVAAVSVEDAVGTDGAAVARVRVLLASPVRHVVHSDRNLIEVNLVPDDSPSRAASPARVYSARGAASSPSGLPATRLEAVRANAGGRGVDLTFEGNGALAAVPTDLIRVAPHRLILDFAGVAPSVPPTIQVGRGAVERVRVAASSANPPATRVVIDLSRPVPYALRTSGDELHVSFTEGEATAIQPPREAAPPAAASGAEQPREAEPRPAPAAAPAAPAPGPQAALLGQAPGSQSLAQASAAGTLRRYTGHPVTLDFQGADLRAVLRTFSEISGLNIVIDPAVQGTVDVALRDVPWDQALDNILRANKLSYVLDGTIVRVAPVSVLSDEEKARRTLSEEQALSGELKVMTKALNYAQAEDLAPLLKDNALSKRGSVAVDKRTNTLVINDLPAFLAKSEALLNSLDQAEGQVEIEARIVSTTKTFARELGVQWGFTGKATPELGNTTGVSFPNTIDSKISINPSGSQTALPNVASLVLGSVTGGLSLSAKLQALENEGRIKVLLQPRVVTQNNVKARVARGQEIPYTTTTAATGTGNVTYQQPMPTVQFKTAALTLEVTPRITPSDTILLQVDVDNGSAGEVQANGNIAINTQRATTTVLVQNGATTVIGGITGSTRNRTDYRTPGLSRIPLLKWLFKSDRISDSDEELLIFITPRVMRLK